MLDLPLIKLPPEPLGRVRDFGPGDDGGAVAVAGGVASALGEGQQSGGFKKRMASSSISLYLGSALPSDVECKSRIVRRYMAGLGAAALGRNSGSPSWASFMPNMAIRC